MNLGIVSLQCLHGEQKKVDTSTSFILTIFSTHSLSSRNAMKKSPTLFPLSQQRLHKLRVLKKLGCQKPCWAQAILSSLVNKQVGFGSLKKMNLRRWDHYYWYPPPVLVLWRFQIQWVFFWLPLESGWANLNLPLVAGRGRSGLRIVIEQMWKMFWQVVNTVSLEGFPPCHRIFLQFLSDWYLGKLITRGCNKPKKICCKIFQQPITAEAKGGWDINAWAWLVCFQCLLV